MIETHKVQKEIVRVGLKKTKNYQSYEAAIEMEIEYLSEDMRASLIGQLYAKCRKQIAQQIEIDEVKKK